MPDGQDIPLSLGQQRLWFLQQLYPDNPFYHYADIYRLRGTLHTGHLLAGIQQVAQRHDILRTTFPAGNGGPTQVIGQEAGMDISEFHLQHFAVDQKEAEARRLAIREARRVLDLNRGPLTRITLIHLDDHDHLLIFTMHHIITDKWSMQVLMEELAEIYRGLNAGSPVRLEQLPFQYADYAYRQRSQPPDTRHLAYWQKKMAGELPLLTLPTDHPRPLRPTFRGALCERRYPASLSSQLKELSMQADTTLFVLLLTAFKVLLFRYSKQEDILVGTPFTNRDQVALEKIIGFFNDTLVLRSDLAGDPPFRDLIKQVRQTVLDAFSHKNTPFEMLVRTLKPERHMSSNPLFQVMFLFQEFPEMPSFGEELTLEHRPLDFGVSKFDLTLYISEGQKGLTAGFEYATDLFEPATIERMHGHLEVLLKGIVADPEQRISALPMLTPPERRQILVEWNNTSAPIPEMQGIHLLFEEQVRQHPDRPAVLFQGRRLNYRDLNDRADRVASYLRSLGLGPNPIIGLYTERSPDMIVGILGILKAGAAYLPLDPEYPEERINFMLQDAGVKVILTQASLQDSLSGSVTRCTVLTGPDILSMADKTLPPVEVKSEDTAYVIYTSGSTGRPKGVPVTHRSLMCSTTARFDYYIHPPACFLLLSSFAFDSSVAGIFWTLCSGGKLVLPERRIEQDMDRLADLIAIHEVSHTLLLPSLYALLLQHAPLEKLTSLRAVIVAGEACSSVVCRSHFQTLPQAALYNEYGPTEATVWCTVHQIQPEDLEGPVPIGRPIANARIYILDQNHQPIPIGIAGELYVGGAGVAQGYLNRPDLTADRFISNPFSDDPADRLYRTGDLARYRPDGLIEFLGRADHQVKIRGYRIELDEIREALRQIPGVGDAAVIVREEQNPDDETGMEEADHLVELLKTLGPGEADRLLRSIEMLSDDELDYLLAEIKNDNTFLL